MSEYFSNNIIFLRNLKKETQSETAMALGLTRSTLANYEVGENMPKLDVIIKIIGHFNVSFDELTNIDLQNLDVSQKRGEIKKGKFLDVNLEPTLDVTGKKEVKSLPIAGSLNSVNAPFKEQLLISTQQKLIESQAAQIQYLQNQIDTMQYTTHEREQTHVAQKKEAKSA